MYRTFKTVLLQVVLLFSSEKRTKLSLRALQQKDMESYRKFWDKGVLNSLLLETWKYAKISPIQVMYKQNFKETDEKYKYKKAKLNHCKNTVFKLVVPRTNPPLALYNYCCIHLFIYDYRVYDTVKQHS